MPPATGFDIDHTNPSGWRCPYCQEFVLWPEFHTCPYHGTFAPLQYPPPQPFPPTLGEINEKLDRILELLEEDL